MYRKVFAPLSSALLLATVAVPLGAQSETPDEEIEVPASQWAVQTELGAGYDTQPNGSTRERTFLGFQLDPRYVGTESAFAEANISAEHTATLAPQRGFVSTLEFGQRVNPDASFANQTIAALGTEGVVILGNTRYSAGVSGYASWLQGHEDERGTHFDLNAAREVGNTETVFTLRTSRLSDAGRDIEDLNVDRYLGAFAITRKNIGARSGTAGLTLVLGRDAPRRVGSPFGNNRYGVQFSGSWALRPQVHAYVELSALRSEYAGSFFGFARDDDQYNVAAALEFEGRPAGKWVLAPQVRYTQNDSSVVLFEYERLEAVLYVRRAL